jgi:hypothetical protein
VETEDGKEAVRRFVPNDSRKNAIAIREDFIDSPATKQETMRWRWPKEMQEVGQWESGAGAVMYASSKWQRNPKSVIDYKHLAEGRQRLLVLPGFLRNYHRPGSKIDVVGPMVELNGPMPEAFAVLAPILGIQANLYDSGTDESPEASGESVYQISIANATLGAAKHPETGQVFLFVYTQKEGPLLIITGEILGVEKDGIVG